MAPKTDVKAVELAVKKAVTAILLDDPFYGYLLLRQEIIPTFDVPTACTNGKCIKYNPDFLRDLSLGQIKGLLKHEVLHTAYMHTTRRQHRDPNGWNYAGDIIINNHLTEAGEQLPPDGAMDPKYNTSHTEHVYNDLMSKGGAPNNPFGPHWNWGACEDHPDATDESSRTEIEEDIKLDVMQAAQQAKVMGKMPAGIERLIDQIRKSKMPWKRILAKFLKTVPRGDETWNRPNRRWLANNIIFPSQESQVMPPVVVAIDTSGSIGTAELEVFFAEVSGILLHTRPEAIYVLYCDASIGNTQKLTVRDLPLTLKHFKPVGGGGTDFRPVFEYIEEKKIKPSALIYLTDMYGAFPNKGPKYPVFWCATSTVVGPFGRTLELKV